MSEKAEEGKQMLMEIDLKEMAFAKLMLSIDAASITGKIAFGIVKCYKTEDYEDGNAPLVWEKLKKKFDPVSTPF